MKTFLSICVLAYACGALAQTPIVTTITVKGTVTNDVGVADCGRVTNTVAIPSGQAARVATVKGNEEIYYNKDGVTWLAVKGDVVQGPVEFVIAAPPCSAASLTLERWTVRKAR